MTADSVTKVEFWDAVVEQGGNSTAILPWLGNIVTDHTGATLDASDLDILPGMPTSSSSGSINAIAQSHSQAKMNSSRLPGAGNPSRFDSQIRELVETERSYVRRLDALYNRYAQPLRQYARHRQQAIIPLYEAQRLFGNVGELLGANMAFLQELEALSQSDEDATQLKQRIGDVTHRHVSCSVFDETAQLQPELTQCLYHLYPITLIDGVLWLLQ